MAAIFGGLFLGETMGQSRFHNNEITSAEGNFKQGMCYTLKRIRNDPQFPSVEKIQDYLERYNCP